MDRGLLSEYIAQLFRHAGNVFTLATLALAVIFPLLSLDQTTTIILTSLAAVASVLAASYLTWKAYRLPDLELHASNLTLALLDGWLQFEEKVGFSLAEIVTLEFSTPLAIHNGAQRETLVGLDIAHTSTDWQATVVSSPAEVRHSFKKNLQGTQSKLTIEAVGEQFRIPASTTAHIFAVGKIRFRLPEAAPNLRTLPPIHKFGVELRLSASGLPPQRHQLAFDTMPIKEAVETTVVNQIRGNDSVKRYGLEPQLLAILRAYHSGSK